MKRDLLNLYKDLEDELVNAEADVEKNPTEVLWKYLDSLLWAVEEKLSQALIFTRDLALDHTEAVHEMYLRIKRDAMTWVRKARSKMSTSPPPVNTSSTNSTSSNQSSDRQESTALSSARSYFQKQTFPRIRGEMTDYLSFRKEWQETVAPSHNQVFQLRQIRKAVPVKIQLDLKNLKTMDEV